MGPKATPSPWQHWSTQAWILRISSECDAARGRACPPLIPFVRSYVHALRRSAKDPADFNKLETASERLQGKLDSFGTKLCAAFPALVEVRPQEAAQPEDVAILLPSLFTEDARAEYGLAHLSTQEHQLRISVLYDTIKKIKTALGVRSFLTRHVRTNSRGYGAVTRGQDASKRAEAVVRRCAQCYRRGWQALEALGIPTHERRGLQKLDDQDLMILSQWIEGEQYKSHGQTLPWIWMLDLDAGEEGAAEDPSHGEQWITEGKIRLHLHCTCLDMISEPSDSAGMGARLRCSSPMAGGDTLTSRRVSEDRGLVYIRLLGLGAQGSTARRAYGRTGCCSTPGVLGLLPKADADILKAVGSRAPLPRACRRAGCQAIDFVFTPFSNSIERF